MVKLSQRGVGVTGEKEIKESPESLLRAACHRLSGRFGPVSVRDTLAFYGGPPRGLTTGCCLNFQEMKVLSFGEGKPEEPHWMSGDGKIVSALSLCPERSERHKANYLLSHHHLNQSSDEMSFFCLPKIHRRAQSRARSEIGFIAEQGEVSQAVTRPTGSTPDLRIGTSTSPSSRPLTPHDQESNGTQTT